jgi:hypothetical protein
MAEELVGSVDQMNDHVNTPSCTWPNATFPYYSAIEKTVPKPEVPPVFVVL